KNPFQTRFIDLVSEDCDESAKRASRNLFLIVLVPVVVLEFKSFRLRARGGGRGRFRNNNKSLPDLSVEQGQMGDGSSPISLSRAGIGRHPRGGCQLPDAILHGKRSHRPRSRAVQCLSATGFRVRLFSSLGLMVAPPACEPGKDTPMTFFFASSPLSSGSATAFGGAFARGHGSRLFTLRLPFAHSPATSFLI